jgi:sodium/bile acid cotransporter 7
MNPMKNQNYFHSFVKKQWFVFAIAVVLLCAWMLPALPTGDWQKVLKLGLVAAIFFFSGLSIRSRELGAGIGNWRLHVFVQLVSLCITVLTCWGLDSLWQACGLDPALRLGLLVLGALPTTVTSCVALTAAAKGNQVGALVNACIGNLMGVIVTPFWLMVMAGATGAEVDVVPVLQKLALYVVLPVICGQVVQVILGDKLPKTARKYLGKTGQVLLLGIMYLSFQKAFNNGAAIPLDLFFKAAAICAGLHALWLAISWYGPLLPPFKLNPADRRCAVICGSQKTLALGLPLISLCFFGHPDLPLIALPILIYHPLQLVVAGGLVPRMAATFKE